MLYSLKNPDFLNLLLAGSTVPARNTIVQAASFNTDNRNKKLKNRFTTSNQFTVIAFLKNIENNHYFHYCPKQLMRIAFNQFCLKIADLGPGTCIIGWFDEMGIKNLLHIDKNIRVPLLVAVFLRSAVVQ